MRVDFGDAGNLPQTGCDLPFEDRSQFHGRITVASHFKLQDFAERGCQRVQFRNSITFGNPICRIDQSFCNDLPSSKNIGSFFKDDGDASSSRILEHF